MQLAGKGIQHMNGCAHIIPGSFRMERTDSQHFFAV